MAGKKVAADRVDRPVPAVAQKWRDRPAQNDTGGIEDAGEVRKPAPQGVRPDRDRLLGRRPLGGEFLKKALNFRRLSAKRPVPRQQRLSPDKALQRAGQGGVGVHFVLAHIDVPELSGKSVLTADQLAVLCDCAADTGVDPHEKRIAHPLAAQPGQFRIGKGVGVIGRQYRVESGQSALHDVEKGDM